MLTGVLQRVTFRYGLESEIWYLDRVPEVGDRVTHRSEIWVVCDVHTDDLGAFVTCEQPRQAPS